MNSFASYTQIYKKFLCTIPGELAMTSRHIWIDLPSDLRLRNPTSDHLQITIISPRENKMTIPCTHIHGKHTRKKRGDCNSKNQDLEDPQSRRWRGRARMGGFTSSCTDPRDEVRFNRSSHNHRLTQRHQLIMLSRAREAIIFFATNFSDPRSCSSGNRNCKITS